MQRWAKKREEHLAELQESIPLPFALVELVLGYEGAIALSLIGGEKKQQIIVSSLYHWVANDQSLPLLEEFCVIHFPRVQCFSMWTKMERWTRWSGLPQDVKLRIRSLLLEVPFRKFLHRDWHRTLSTLLPIWSEKGLLLDSKCRGVLQLLSWLPELMAEMEGRPGFLRLLRVVSAKMTELIQHANWQKMPPDLAERARIQTERFARVAEEKLAQRPAPAGEVLQHPYYVGGHEMFEDIEPIFAHDLSGPGIGVFDRGDGPS